MGLAGQAVARASSAPDLALLLALEATAPTTSVESRSGLLTVLQRTSRVKRLVSASPGEVVSGLSDDGRTFAESDLRGSVRLVDFASRASERRRSSTNQRGPVSVFFSPDGRLVATTSEDGTRAALGCEGAADRCRTLRAHTAPVRAADFSPDGRQLVTEDSAGFSYLWDTTTGGRRAASHDLLTPHIDVSSAPTGPASPSPGSRRRCSTSPMAPRSTERTFHGPLSTGNVALSPDGTLLATGSPGAVEVWDVASSRLRVTLRVGTLTGRAALLAGRVDAGRRPGRRRNHVVGHRAPAR